jgi:hypothetical protein
VSTLEYDTCRKELWNTKAETSSQSTVKIATKGYVSSVDIAE